MKQLFAASVILVVTAACIAAEPEPKKADNPAKPPEYTISEMRIQTIPAKNFIYGSATTTFEKLGEVIEKFIPLLSKGMDDGKIRPEGSCMFVYKGIQEDMTKPFTLEIGWLVSDKTQAQGELKVRKTDEFKCATVILSGKISNISKAYEKLMPAVMEAKLTPTAETRELYLHWEGPESDNNVVQIQMGVK
jgi:effector-binding domain-containing protein